MKSKIIIITRTKLLAAFAALSLPATAQFTPGNLAVVHVGDGSVALGSFGAPVSIEEYTSSGTLAHTYALPTTGPDAFIMTANASAEGGLSFSLGGFALTFAGYNVGLPFGSSPASASAATAPRVVGFISSSGASSIGIWSPTAFDTLGIRSGVADTFGNYWGVGSGAGLVYLNYNSAVASSPSANRVLNIVNNQLYWSSESTPVGIYKVAGLPTYSVSASAVITTAGTGTGTASPYAFAFHPAFTVAYVCDDRTTANGGGVQRWNWNGSAWALAYTLNTAGGVGARGLAVDFSGANPVLYATTAEADNNRLVRIIDTGAGSAEADLASAGPNRAFRGLEFAPLSPPFLANRIKSLGTSEGSSPNPLTEGTDGALYGTAVYGGSSGQGVVFRLQKNGSNYTVLHNFTGGSADGAQCQGGLVEGADGRLYGTTFYGGSAGQGTVFKLNKDGSGFAVLHSFNDAYGGDASQPEAGLIQATDGGLYGTTSDGGTYFSGAVFKLNTDGTGYAILHDFTYSESGRPRASLKEASDGKLYGTTSGDGNLTFGSVFSLNKDGSGYAVLHSFTLAEGASLVAPVIEATDGFLYGTTAEGGANYIGTVFKLSKSGSTFSRLYSFSATGGDADYPNAGLVEWYDGALYGTSFYGGSAGAGTVFKINKDGTSYSLLGSFTGLLGDGELPEGLLLASDGALYTATSGGGDLGNGAIFRFLPPLQVTVPPSATEGDGTLAGAGRLQLSAALSTNLTVTLSSSDTSRVTVPASAVLLAGQTNASFDVTIRDDSVLDGTQMATIAASAPGLGTVSTTIAVVDNETATLQVLLPASATEGQATVQGTVQLSAVPAANITVSLASSDMSLFQVPTSIVLPAGQTSAVFTATVTSEKLMGGDQTATVTAHVANWTDGTATITIHERVDHFQWSGINSPQFINRLFAVTITAKDEFNITVSNFTGTVGLSGSVPGGLRTSSILPSPAFQYYGSGGQYSDGYSFTPNTNITVTAVRHYFGSKVSIWTDSGTLLASQNVTSVGGTWVETPLATPLLLLAGCRYRVAVFSSNVNYYWRYDMAATFPDGTINQSYQGSGDAMPTFADSMRWWFVDLKYTVGSSQPLPISPTASGNFTNGTWTGNLTVSQPATNLTLLADDLAGHTGQAKGFNVIADTIPPSILCPSNIVVHTDAGQCSAMVTYSLSATDNCAVVSLVGTPPSGSAFAKGTNIVTCVATDCAGNTNACSFTVTVVDHEPPMLVCPTNQTVAAVRTNGVPVFFTPTASDNCDSSVTVVCTPPSGSVFGLGTNIVACVATDSNGNTNSCTFIVTVTEAPPSLTIGVAGTNCVVSWPPTYSVYVLEQKADLDPAVNWVPVNTSPSWDGTNFVISLPLQQDSRVFRLRSN